jgi:hypothetical protein
MRKQAEGSQTRRSPRDSAMLRVAALAAAALCISATDVPNTPSARRLQGSTGATLCADITGDGVVDVNDLLALLAAYQTVVPEADITGNPTELIDVSDLLALLGEFGMSCTRSSGTVTPYSSYLFNLDPAGDNTGLRDWVGANSIQLAEITLYDAAGTPLRDGLTCTNPGGSNPGGELPEHACNGLTASDPEGCSGCANSGHKWLDFNKGDLVMTFTGPVSVNSWDWQTANDAPARDPVMWTLEGSNDGASWTVIDSSAASGFDTPSARFTWVGPFFIGSPPPASSCDTTGAVDVLVPFLAGEGGAADVVSGRTVALTGHAVVEVCGLRLDGDGDRATIANFDYASDGAWTVGYWFSKHMCTGGPWEYVYSHAANTGSILELSNPNINAYIGCSNTGASFMRTIVVDDNQMLLTYDISLANVGNFDAVTQAWVYYVQSWSVGGMTLVVDGTEIDTSALVGFDTTGPQDAAQGGTLAAFAGDGYSGSTMATDIFIGARADAEVARHFVGLIAGVGISSSSACPAAMIAWFTNFEPTINIASCIVPETSCGAGATTTGGSVAEGSLCTFPFTYNGDTYNECTNVDNGAVKWCSVEATYDTLWGDCVCDGSNADDTYDSEVVTYNWIDISASGIQVALTDWTHDTNTWASDDGYVTFDLPFVFPFYEQSQSQVSIGTNGYITFGTAHYAFGNSMTIPTPAGTLGGGDHAAITVDSMIAMLWCDLDPSSGGGNSAVYVEGSAGAAVASYVNIPFCCGSPTPANTFQIILFPTGSVKMNYMTLQQGGSQEPSIGYEDENGARGEQIAYGWAEAPADNSALSIVPNGNGALPADPNFDGATSPTYVVSSTS